MAGLTANCQYASATNIIMSINYVQKYVQQRYHKEDNVLKQFPTTVKRRWEIL